MNAHGKREANASADSEASIACQSSSIHASSCPAPPTSTAVGSNGRRQESDERGDRRALLCSPMSEGQARNIISISRLHDCGIAQSCQLILG